MPLLSLETNSIAQLITVILLFLVVLVLTYFVTKWTASFQKGRGSEGNIEVLDTCKIAPDKYVQIIRVADKYMAIGVGKDTVSFLSEVDPNEVYTHSKTSKGSGLGFKELLEKAKEKKNSNE